MRKYPDRTLPIIPNSLNIFIEHNDIMIEYLEDNYVRLYFFNPPNKPKTILRKRIRGKAKDYINYLNKVINIPHTYHDKPKMKWQKSLPRKEQPHSKMA
jgi:hypothetical protein